MKVFADALSAMGTHGLEQQESGSKFRPDLRVGKPYRPSTQVQPLGPCKCRREQAMHPSPQVRCFGNVRLGTMSFTVSFRPKKREDSSP